MEAEVPRTGLAVVGWNPQGGGTSPRTPWLSPPTPGMSPLGPKLRWSRGQQPDGQRLEGDFEEEDKLGGFEILGDGESSNQTVSWILFSCFELYVCGTAGSVLSSVVSVVVLL